MRARVVTCFRGVGVLLCSGRLDKTAVLEFLPFSDFLFSSNSNDGNFFLNLEFYVCSAQRCVSIRLFCFLRRSDVDIVSLWFMLPMYYPLQSAKEMSYSVGFSGMCCLSELIIATSLCLVMGVVLTIYFFYVTSDSMLLPFLYGNVI